MTKSTKTTSVDTETTTTPKSPDQRASAIRRSTEAHERTVRLNDAIAGVAIPATASTANGEEQRFMANSAMDLARVAVEEAHSAYDDASTSSGVADIQAAVRKAEGANEAASWLIAHAARLARRIR
jgi:hypothetical protein